ncbi:MAG: tRNA epoxyqueuosine(34) reductase QueG [Proteobacteria bacterium]|nr:tRNA epoxyqueuosine(34) reductase QueG [Pseudomonadota bacterium]
MDRSQLTSLLQDHQLLLLGLVDLGPQDEPNFPLFENWLAEGQHAGMYYLEQNKNLRKNPRGLLAGACQVLMFAMPYGQGDKLQAARRGHYRVAQYARLRDYHKLMRAKALAILDVLQKAFPGLEGRVTVDSAPILERALAARTSQGFIGKNTCFILPNDGSLILIGELILTQTIMPSDEQQIFDPGQRTQAGGCGSCKRCQVNCPTGALDTAYKLDARLCLAYWTIEHRGCIPFEFWKWLPSYIFGCDLCQLACPYNRLSKLTSEEIRLDLKNPDLFELAILSQAHYESWMGGTPMTRAKREGLRRNALIALTVLKDERLDAALSYIKADDPDMLRETAAQIEIWRRNTPV